MPKKTRKTRAQKQRIQTRRSTPTVKTPAKPKATAAVKKTPVARPAKSTKPAKQTPVKVTMADTPPAAITARQRALRLSLVAFAALIALQLSLWGLIGSGIIDLTGLLNSIQL